MATLACPNCGEEILVDSLDEPPKLVEHPADAHSPRRLVIIGGQSQWLIHECEIAEGSQVRHDD